MKIVIEKEIKNCYDCPYSSNSAQEYTRRLAPVPTPVVWYCNYTVESRIRVYIANPNKEIADGCPIKNIKYHCDCKKDQINNLLAAVKEVFESYEYYNYVSDPVDDPELDEYDIMMIPIWNRLNDEYERIKREIE